MGRGVYNPRSSWVKFTYTSRGSTSAFYQYQDQDAKLTPLMSLNPPLAGSYDFTITITDEAGNTSKGLSGTLTAQ